MARARNIKPGFFTNGDLLECQPLARLLFAGLWTEADCRGILEDRPKTLKIKLLPGDNCDVDELLNELAAHGFIDRYESDGVRCIVVKNFEKHQNPHVNEKPNTLPAPEQHRASTVLAPERVGAGKTDTPYFDGAVPAKTRINTDGVSSTVLAPEQHQSAPAETIYTTDSPIPQPESKSRKSRDRLGEPVGFDVFWSEYPRKTAKEDARRAFRKINPDGDLFGEMMTALRDQKTWPQWREGVIPHPATWLNGCRWEDEPPPRRASQNGRRSEADGPPPEHPDWLWDDDEHRWRAPHLVG